MTSYMFIGGPLHGEVMEIAHGATVMMVRDTASGLHHAFAPSGEPAPSPGYETYRVWTVPAEVCPDAPGALPLMKLETMPDAIAMRELGALLRPRLDAIKDRLRPPEVDAFRDFLDQVDAHGRIPPAAWRFAKPRTPPIAP